MPKNVGDLGKLIVPKGFKKLSKAQKIAQSGQTDFKLSGSFAYMKTFLFPIGICLLGNCLPFNQHHLKYKVHLDYFHP